MKIANVFGARECIELLHVLLATPPLNLTDFTLYCFLLVSDLTFFCSPFSVLFSLLLVDFLYKSLSWQCNAN